MADLQITDYASLKDGVAQWLNRADLTEQIPAFIQLAERMFETEVRWRGMLTHDTTIVDEVYEDLPPDFLELRSIRFNTNPVVKPDYLSPSQIEDYRARNAGAGGTPTHYTIVGTQLLFDRVPSGDPELDITSYVKVPPLDGTVQTTNALLMAYPGLYLYGTLMQAEPFLKNDPRLATWTALYQSLRDGISAADRRAERNPGPMTMRSKRSF